MIENYPRGSCADKTYAVCTAIFLALTRPFSQALLKEVGEWRRHEESDNCLRRRFEESKQELERVLQKAQSCLKETGDAEVLLRKHSVRQWQPSLPDILV